MKNTLLVLLAIITLSACKKEKTEVFNSKPGISFFYVVSGNVDSTNYSFANQLTQKSQDTIFVRMRVMGTSVDYDREIEVKSLPASTAKEGTHFILPKIKLPAGSLTTTYPIVLINTEDLKTNTYHLEVAVAENKDFVQGVIGQANVTTRNIPLYKINFNNQLIEPDYWKYIANYFGAYSKVKHRFMIDVLGMSDFRPDSIGGEISYSDFLNYNVKLKNALKDNEKVNGPMLDETGQQISFPL
ncbi:MAG: DUF4843 domain-containing protein [Ginsengibacter sp.]